MFPEITREDVFRLETRRMWLRWPCAADAVTPKADADAVLVGCRMPDGATLDGWRRENAAGSALHLILTGHGSDRTPFGAVSLSPVRERIEDCGLVLQGWLLEDRRGSGLMTEAMQALVDAGFMLTDTSLVAASARVLDPGFRRVLEKCGFAYCGTGLDRASTDGALAASDRFRLDRKAWTSLKTWRIPAVVRRRESNQALCPA